MLEGLILGVALMTSAAAAVPADTSPPAMSSQLSEAAAPAQIAGPEQGAPSAAASQPSDGSSPATAAPAETAGPPADATPAEQPATSTTNQQDRPRCHRAPPEVGSMMGRRICSTRSQDRARAQRDAAELERMQRMDNH